MVVETNNNRGDGNTVSLPSSISALHSTPSLPEGLRSFVVVSRPRGSDFFFVRSEEDKSIRSSNVFIHKTTFTQIIQAARIYYKCKDKSPILMPRVGEYVVGVLSLNNTNMRRVDLHAMFGCSETSSPPAPSSTPTSPHWFVWRKVWFSWREEDTLSPHVSMCALPSWRITRYTTQLPVFVPCAENRNIFYLFQNWMPWKRFESPSVLSLIF